MNPGPEEKLDEIDRRLREVEQTLAGLKTTQRIIGGILILFIPILTHLIDAL